MARRNTLTEALFGPTGRWTFVLVISRKDGRVDLPRSEDDLGVLPYKKIAVYSTLERATHDAAWEAASEYWELPGFPEGGFWTAEENAAWEPARAEAKARAQAAKEAMLDPRNWSVYESTDNRAVWFYPGPQSVDYRIIASRVDRYSELPADAPQLAKKLSG